MGGLDALAGHRYLSLVTFRRTGAAVATAVWFAPLDGRLYVVTGGDAGKVKRLRVSSRARVAPCDSRGRTAGPWRDVTARLIDDPPLIARAHRALRERYGWQMRALDLVSRLSGRIRRRAWIEIAG